MLVNSRVVIGIGRAIVVFLSGGYLFFRKGTMWIICQCIWMLLIRPHCLMAGVDTLNSAWLWLIRFTASTRYERVCSLLLLLSFPSVQACVFCHLRQRDFLSDGTCDFSYQCHVVLSNNYRSL